MKHFTISIFGTNYGWCILLTNLWFLKVCLFNWKWYGFVADSCTFAAINFLTHTASYYIILCIPGDVHQNLLNSTIIYKCWNLENIIVQIVFSLWVNDMENYLVIGRNNRVCSNVLKNEKFSQTKFPIRNLSFTKIMEPINENTYLWLIKCQNMIDRLDQNT